LTIGSVCRLMNRSVVDAILEWPRRDAKLQVGGGPTEERAIATKLFSRLDAAYVIDGATLIEFGRIDCLHLLEKLPKLFCTTMTYEIIREVFEESKQARSSGTAISHEGELAFIEITEEMWDQRTTFLGQVIGAIEKYCKILPSYGPDNYGWMSKQLGEIISIEDTASLALSLELGATLFSLDARLRLLGATCGLAGVWPQVFLSSCLTAGEMSKRDYSVACLKLFLSGRNFISLDGTDLLFAVYQGEHWVASVIPAFQQHIAEADVDLNSAYRVVMGFLECLLISGPCQFGFFIEMTGLLIEGLARHKHCTNNLADSIKINLQSNLNLDNNKLRLLWRAVDSAFLRARNKYVPPIFKGKILFCSAPPQLMNGLTQHDVAELLDAPVLERQPLKARAVDQFATSGVAIDENE